MNDNRMPPAIALALISVLIAGTLVACWIGADPLKAVLV